MPRLPRDAPAGGELSERGVVGFAGADPDHAIDVGDEDLTVPDLPGLGRLEYGLDDLVDQVGAHGNLHTRLRDEIHHVLRTPVELGVAALTTEALHLGDGHAGDADLRERRADIVELEGFDDCRNQFHARTSASVLVRSAASPFRQSAPFVPRPGCANAPSRCPSSACPRYPSTNSEQMMTAT